MVNGKIHGEKQLYANMNKYAKLMDVGVQDAMEKVIEHIVEKAKALAPMDTGKLRSSVVGVVKKMSADIIEGHVEASVAYAQYIEFGTSTSQAQPFLTPAIDAALKILTHELQDAHKRAARRLSK